MGLPGWVSKSYAEVSATLRAHLHPATIDKIGQGKFIEVFILSLRSQILSHGMVV